MEDRKETPWKDLEIGFVRKSDGKIVNVKLYEVAKRFCTADFVNNEIKINGETLIADSFRAPYSEVTLNVQKKSLNGGDGSYQVQGEIFETNKIFTVEKNSVIKSTLLPNQDSLVKAVLNENNMELIPVENVVSIQMEKDHTMIIAYDSNVIK
jgi:hypothetical protein